MTWGQQNSEAEGHMQLDYALERGVNFIDTAEMYSTPARKETQGNTEKIIGSWLKNAGNREKVVLASKIAGPGNAVAHIRPNLGFSKAALTEAIDSSLKRLQTDYIDLYQLHWPERNTNFFGLAIQFRFGSVFIVLRFSAFFSSIWSIGDSCRLLLTISFLSQGFVLSLIFDSTV
jgi:aryl-alcohol dehydrogenase-like predicted oxidoreductase